MNKSEIAVRHEPMRIAGRKVDAADVVEVRYPYTDQVIGTVPAGNAEHAREAFEVAASYQPSFTRYERQQILFRAAELIREKRDWLAHWLTLELGICHQHALYETGRSYDVFTLAGQMAILDDSQIFSCDLTPQGKARKIYTKREPVGGDLGDHAVQSPPEHGQPQDRTCDRHQQLRGLQADRTDAADRHRPGGYPV